MMWLFLWILWFTLVFQVITDVFRDDTLGGWGKAGWMVLVLVLPFIGVLLYLIARGHGMGEREVAWRAKHQARYYEAAQSESVRIAAKAEELTHLAELKEHGELTEQGYERAKSKVLSG